jgi:hypothetical protein
MRLFNIGLRFACIGLITTDDQEKSNQLVRWKEMVPTSLLKQASLYSFMVQEYKMKEQERENKLYKANK